MNGRCATCKWWGFPAYWDAERITEERTSGLTPIPEAAKQCSLHSDQSMDVEGQKIRHGLFLQPSDPYIGSDVWTLPDFGCTQWETTE